MGDKAKKYEFTEEELEEMEGGLSLVLDQWPYGSGKARFSEVEALRDKLRKILGREPVEKKWKAKANKITTPDGRTFNLRVDEEREAFLALMNGESE